MSGRLISVAEFAAKIAAEQEDSFVWSDLLRFDYDAPKERVALVSWREERVDEFGEVLAGEWRVIMAGDGRRWSELHDWGVLNFGLPPWRNSQVLRVVGRLGSIEAAVKALVKPAPDFVYSFECEAPWAPVARPGGRRVAPAAAVELLSRPKASKAVQERARWRRATRPEKRQGELF